jgi:transcriptional regulator with PAS, ATPase and Fis domain
VKEKEDIKILVNHFISQINERENLNVTGVDKTVLELFMEYNWPGNIRELENIVEWCVNMADDKIIRLKDLPNDFIQSFLSKKMEKSDPILEKRILNTTLSNVNGNVNKASALLGVSRRTLYRKFEKYDIDPSNFRNQSS